MTKAHALRMLLRHGPMNFHEIVECTGWHPKEVKDALRGMSHQRQLVRGPRVRAAGRPASMQYETRHGVSA